MNAELVTDRQLDRQTEYMNKEQTLISTLTPSPSDDTDTRMLVPAGSNSWVQMLIVYAIKLAVFRTSGPV